MADTTTPHFPFHPILNMGNGITADDFERACDDVPPATVLHGPNNGWQQLLGVPGAFDGLPPVARSLVKELASR